MSCELFRIRALIYLPALRNSMQTGLGFRRLSNRHSLVHSLSLPYVRDIDRNTLGAI